MTGGHHDAAIHPALLAAEYGKIYFFGSTETDILDINTTIKQSLNHRPGNRLAGKAHIMTNNYSLCGKLLTESAAYPGGDDFVKLIGNTPSNIIGGKTGKRDRHEEPLYTGIIR